MMDEAEVRDRGRLALALGAVAAGSPVCLATYFAVGGPFGTINDIGNAAIGVLSAALAWRLRRHLQGRAGDIVLGAAMVGAAITVVGSALVVSRTTGFFFAGLVSSVGFAAIGAWLVVANRTDELAAAWPRRLRSLGQLAGGLMIIGVAAVPGITLGFDDAATAPGWIWVSSIGWLGTYVAYPVWAIAIGLAATRRVRSAAGSPATGQLNDGEEVRSWTGG
jgi:uncharacterized membrane protein (GlpM family)